MDQRNHAAEPPAGASLAALRTAAADCTACPLYAGATQTVFGEGAARAAILLIGEQPGDREDLAGHPFVGPAGQLLDRALAAAGIDRSQTYVTNAVKHFKYVQRGKKRIHQRPNTGEISACQPWLRAEIGRVQPQVIVCLGATAAQSLLGPSFRVTQSRGLPQETEFAPALVATVHPSSLLRLPDAEQRAAEFEHFVADLRAAAALVAAPQARKRASEAKSMLPPLSKTPTRRPRAG